MDNLFDRLVSQAIGMTAADLCASAKPWEVQAQTVRVIFEEFYEQGDIEKLQGRKPIPMMDREMAHQLPSSQVRKRMTDLCQSKPNCPISVRPEQELRDTGTLSFLLLFRSDSSVPSA